LFGEGPGGFVVSGSAVAVSELAQDVPLYRLGTVGGDSLELGLAQGAEAQTIVLSLDELSRTHASLRELFS
jgi:phosphoribosylformylglycinamidine synthase